MDIVPRPIAFKVIKTLSEAVHGKFISNLEEWAGTFVDIRTTILFCQVLMIQRFQNSDLTHGEGIHYLFITLKTDHMNVLTIRLKINFSLLLVTE